METKDNKEKIYACCKVLPPNEYGNAFVRAGVVMYTKIDVDYDNPDIDFCKKIVLDDFSNKILTIFKQNPFNMAKKTPHCQIYDEIDRRWFRYYESLPITYECKELFKLTGTADKIAEYVQEYIKDYMQHAYIGRGVDVPTSKDIWNWCGGGEFPFLITSLIRNAQGDVSIAYYLSR